MIIWSAREFAARQRPGLFEPVFDIASDSGGFRQPACPHLQGDGKMIRSTSQLRENDCGL